MALLSMPAGCGGRVDSQAGASDGSAPVRPNTGTAVRDDDAQPLVFADDAGITIEVTDASLPTDDADITIEVTDASLPTDVGGPEPWLWRYLDASPPSFVSNAAGCSWVQSWTPNVVCSWAAEFVGDPLTCLGFSQTGTFDPCVAVCGTNGMVSPESCWVQGAGVGAHALECDGPTCTSTSPVIPPGNGGRRPDYFASLGFGPALAGREVGTHFARVACMEAGSIEAFRRLRDELHLHRAPDRLVRVASRAMRDEIRHVRQTSALARRFRERPVAPLPVPPRVPRSLEAVALENAVEGCIRETYSALECLWQSHRAGDAVVKATMARIARDELRHLAVSWAVDSWCRSKLGRAAARRLRDAQHEEVLVLAREMSRDPAESLVAIAGLPRASQSRALIGVISEQLQAA
jgi:hypothetical protein